MKCYVERSKCCSTRQRSKYDCSTLTPRCIAKYSATYTECSRFIERSKRRSKYTTTRTTTKCFKRSKYTQRSKYSRRYTKRYSRYIENSNKCTKKYVDERST